MQIEIPKEIFLMLYRDCQLDCKFCYTEGINLSLEPGELLNLYKNIIKSYEVEGDYPRLIIGGLGEPTFGRNYILLEELVKTSPKNKFIIISNQVEPEKTISLVKNYLNIEKVVSRIIGRNGGDLILEGKGRPSVEELVQRYKEAGVMDKLEFEILLLSTNTGEEFPVSMLNRHNIQYFYTSAAPLGKALETRLYLCEEELINQSEVKGSPHEFFGATNCTMVEQGLTVIGLDLSLCPCALVKEVYARIPEKYTSKLIDSKEELEELRKVISSLIAIKKGRHKSTGTMCIGRDFLYSKLS